MSCFSLEKQLIFFGSSLLHAIRLKTYQASSATITCVYRAILTTLTPFWKCKHLLRNCHPQRWHSISLQNMRLNEVPWWQRKSPAGT